MCRAKEYEAEFLEDSAGVFRNLEACLLPAPPRPTGDVAIGCDLAKHTDWTVLIALDRRTGTCLDLSRRSPAASEGGPVPP